MPARAPIDWSLVADLGQVPDRVIAERLGVDRTTVRDARVARGIPAHRPRSNPVDWSQIRGLGTMPDRVIAAVLGLRPGSVSQARRAAGIAAHRPTAPRALDLGRPLGTVVAGGAKHALVAAWMVKHYGGVIGHELDRPIGTVTTQDHHSLGTATIVPAGSDRRAEVRAFLDRFEAGGQLRLGERRGIVTIDGVDYEIADIGMRMLTPRELFRAQAFPDDYQIELDHEGKPLSKTTQIALAGNSVPPVMAEAIVRANVAREPGRAAA